MWEGSSSPGSAVDRCRLRPSCPFITRSEQQEGAPRLSFVPFCRTVRTCIPHGLALSVCPATCWFCHPPLCHIHPLNRHSIDTDSETGGDRPLSLLIVIRTLLAVTSWSPLQKTKKQTRQRSAARLWCRPRLSRLGDRSRTRSSNGLPVRGCFRVRGHFCMWALYLSYCPALLG